MGGRRIVDRVADALRPVSDRLVLAANDVSAGDWLPGVAVLPDEHRGAGGLAGVHAALSLGHDALVVAWDMPFVTTGFLAALLERARTSRALAVVPESHSRHGMEPFCAFYSLGMRRALDAFLEGGGGRAAGDFLASTNGVERLSLADVRAIGDPRRLFLSVNTSDDLARANAMAGDPQ